MRNERTIIHEEPDMSTDSLRRAARPAALAALAALLLLAGTDSAAAQIPDEFTNLKILPKEIAKDELVGIMRGYAGALGVRCNHCHVGPENLQGMDFATDEKPAKKTAREMMKMVLAINSVHLASIETGRDRRVEVTCHTCHRGITVPERISDVVAHTIESDGLEAAMKRYRELREEYYGSASYDFSQRPLNSLAESLAREKKLDEALALSKLNVELNPGDAWTRMMLGGILRARGDRDGAIAAYEKAVELEPGNAWAKKQLARIRQEGGGQ